MARIARMGTATHRFRQPILSVCSCLVSVRSVTNCRCYEKPKSPPRVVWRCRRHEAHDPFDLQEATESDSAISIREIRAIPG
jgi:hypothetical protein